MLVISRKRDQVIVIGDKVKLHVLNISAPKVQLGVEAPREVTVKREPAKPA